MHNKYGIQSINESNNIYDNNISNILLLLDLLIDNKADCHLCHIHNL